MSIDANRPLRVLDKALSGGLGVGNLGVICARHGTGKVAVLMSIAIDKAMDQKPVLHVTVGDSVADVRAYRDEVLEEIEKSLGIEDHLTTMTNVERHSRIHTYRGGTFSIERLRQTLAFAKEHAEFSPELIEIAHWPEDFSEVSREDLEGLKTIATDFGCEVWLTAHTSRETEVDASGLPAVLAPFAELLSVVISMEPEARRVLLKFVKVHDGAPPAGINLDFDPRRMLLRWR